MRGSGVSALIGHCVRGVWRKEVTLMVPKVCSHRCKHTMNRLS